MSLDTMFTLEVLLVVVLLVGFADGAIYIWFGGRRSEPVPNKTAHRGSETPPRQAYSHGRFQKESAWRRTRR